MAERKVISKYFPPDYDPTQVTKTRKGRGSGISGGGGSINGKQTVRLMTPFSMRCTTCGEFIYKGKKFNARKEETGERYFTVKIFRFHIRCTRCSNPITFKTDPKNADFTAESGATRNVEPWRAPKAAEGDDETELDKLAEEEEATAMEQLEVKTVDARREMEIADALDEIRVRNAKAGRMDPDV
ncbi:CWC16 protein, partial [Protomyces lactucae-debilis]